MRAFAHLERFRDCSKDVQATFGLGDEHTAVFNIPTRGHAYALKVLASAHSGWDHVSASLPDRCPTWLEMDGLARLLFRDDETAMQLHVPHAQHVDHHPYSLHMWRPIDQSRPIPRPPASLVGAPPDWPAGPQQPSIVGTAGGLGIEAGGGADVADGLLRQLRLTRDALSRLCHGMDVDVFGTTLDAQVNGKVLAKVSLAEILTNAGVAIARAEGRT